MLYESKYFYGLDKSVFLVFFIISSMTKRQTHPHKSQLIGQLTKFLRGRGRSSMAKNRSRAKFIQTWPRLILETKKSTASRRTTYIQLKSSY